MSKRQIAAMIARRRAAQKSQSQNSNTLLAACIDAGGFSEHRTY